MRFLKLRPNVPGELGSRARIDPSTHPPRVEPFHLELTNWGGDDLVECFPCFAVTRELAAALTWSDLSGISFAEMLTSLNPMQAEVNPLSEVPQFRRLLVTGIAGRDDAGISATHHLVVSDRFMAILREFNISYCNVEPWRR